MHGVVIKSLSTTRWPAQADAKHSLKENFVEIRSALIRLAEDEDQTTSTRSEASSLVSKMQHFKIGFLCVRWDSILQLFNATSKRLQKIEIDLATCVHLYESLLEFVRSVRNDEAFENFEEIAKLLVEDYSYRAQQQRPRKRKRYFEETDKEVVMSPRQKFKSDTLFSILDSLATELMIRKEVYCKLQIKFGFLFHITTLSEFELREAASNLQQHL